MVITLVIMTKQGLTDTKNCIKRQVELQKTVVDCDKGLIYIVTMTEAWTNRH